ncbi:MAG: hypothetical protein ACPIOQ_46560, partial [Promethearchaeia archaeon]
SLSGRLTPTGSDSAASTEDNTLVGSAKTARLLRTVDRLHAHVQAQAHAALSGQMVKIGMSLPACCCVAGAACVSIYEVLDCSKAWWQLSTSKRTPTRDRSKRWLPASQQASRTFHRIHQHRSRRCHRCRSS